MNGKSALKRPQRAPLAHLPDEDTAKKMTSHEPRRDSYRTPNVQAP